jgi:hypothetical protein
MKTDEQDETPMTKSENYIWQRWIGEDGQPSNGPIVGAEKAPVDETIPQIGGWWTNCCIHDLEQIKTAEDLESCKEAVADKVYDRAEYWPTLEAALNDLEQRKGLDGDFERGMFYALRRYFGLPMTDKSCVKPDRPSEKP